MKPTYKKLIVSLVALIFVQFAVLQAKYSHHKKCEFIVFNKKKNTIITERNGAKVTVFANKNCDENSILKSYLVANFCQIEQKRELSNLYYFKDKRILVIDSSVVYLENQKAAIIILINSPKVNLERLFISWKPQQVVVDGSNFKSYVKLWKATCRKEKIPFHDTSEKGFYKL